LDEILVVAGEAEEFLDFVDILGANPFLDLVNFGLLHLDCSSPYLYA